MDKIFIDCGAHCGCSRRKVNELMPDFKVYSFEPDPDFNKFCPDLINKAAWINDGTLTYYKFGLTGAGSLMLERKKRLEDRVKFSKELSVKCFNLDTFIKSFNKNDCIYLKLDIEGAEYTLIPFLLENSSMEYINILYMEWHNVRLGISRDVDKKLEDEIKSLDVKIQHWDAMNAKYCIGKNN